MPNTRNKSYYTQIANSLTLFRSISGFFIILLLINDHLLMSWLLILLSALSDCFDGWFARRSEKGSSKWGAKLDPLADKLLLLGPFLWLATNNIIPLWSIWLLFSRELIISAWRSNQKDGGPSSLQAKLKTSFQFTSIIFMLWPVQLGGEIVVYNLNNFGYIIFWPSLIFALSSLIDYFKNKTISDQS